MSAFDGCSDACGWAAAIVSVVSFGSFGVPIKLSSSVEVHPLVMQSYKTIVCFLTCWLVVFLGEEIRWSNWGLMSGLFWVPGAACGIYGIRNAGLAAAVGTWSSIIVLTSFLFGFVFFQEEVKSLHNTAMAFVLLIVGLIGMSRYSAPQQSISTSKNIASSFDESIHSSVMALEMEPLNMDNEEEIMKGRFSYDFDTKDPYSKDRLVFCSGRVSLTKRQLGILGAVINGAWGGMNLVPLHFAKQDGLSGAGYLISYACGAFVVNALVWLLFLVYYLYFKNWCLEEAVASLPKWHVSRLWVPGLAAGLLYSLGNFASIIAVTYLGQGTGFSFCQMQLFVSGLWGVFYFEEIKGSDIVLKWFVSAFIAIVGIVWLSHEHVGDSVGHRMMLEGLREDL